ncbi:small acid-soluble spore protein O [Bacillus inaquosorum]|nr:small acid-soluble spore protein O [Bacillus inaquosorum]
MNDAKSQGKGAGYVENDQLVLTEAERQNNKKKNQSITPDSFKEVLFYDQ